MPDPPEARPGSPFITVSQSLLIYFRSPKTFVSCAGVEVLMRSNTTWSAIALGVTPETISVPQLEMHPLVHCAAVPGAPVGDFDCVQKSVVVPHCGDVGQYGNLEES